MLWHLASLASVGYDVFSCVVVRVALGESATAFAVVFDEDTVQFRLTYDFSEFCVDPNTAASPKTNFYNFFTTISLDYCPTYRQPEGAIMTFIYALSALLALALFIYLLVALFFPEKF
jgi:K+-transporting ATPase KdpF subunit